MKPAPFEYIAPESIEQAVAALVQYGDEAKILAGGIAMLAVGITLTALFSAAMPVGQTGMTDEEALDLLLAQQEIHDYNTLSGILIAIGFLLVLISFGARARRRRGAAGRDRKTETRDEGGLSRT